MSKHLFAFKRDDYVEVTGGTYAKPYEVCGTVKKDVLQRGTFVQVEFDEPETISAYRLYSDELPLGFYPTAWTLSGSNDGSTFVLIDTQSGISWSNGESKVFQVS